MRLGSPVSSDPDPAARAGDQAAGSDILLDPWLCALRFLGEDRARQPIGIGAIRGERALYRAPLVVGMVTSCAPTGLGALFLNLKDQTGTIGASVHKKVISDGNLGNGISVGSVIVLKEVAVFRPSRTACYLNVTQQNVVKVLQVDSVSKQVISSSTTESQLPAAKCSEAGRFACLGDNHMERRTKIETSEGPTAIPSKISRTRDSRVAEVLSHNSGAANAIDSTILRMGRGSIHGVENHHKIKLDEMDSSPPRMNVPSYNTNQHLQKFVNSMNSANCHQRQGGSSPKYGSSSEAESSTNNIMKRLLGGETMMPKKGITVAEVSRDHRGTPDASNSTSRMDTAAGCSSEKHQEIGLQNLVEGSKHVSNRNSDEHQQQNLNISNSRCSQPSLGGSSVMSGNGDYSQATANEKLMRLFDGECMLPSSKRLKSDVVLPDGIDARMNSNSSNGLKNNLNIGLDDIAEGFWSEDTSIRKLNEHQQEDFDAANAGTVQPTQENCCTPATNATAISGSLLSNPKKLASVASAAEWTDEQLSELFADY